MSNDKEPIKTDKKDFVIKDDVKWCPGCGDFAILSAVQNTMVELGIEPHKFVCVSGIGCSSRFPYYINTYGFHSLHGRANAIATGIKLARTDLDVWIMTGDGDSMAIGGNHFIHLIRRNLNVNLLLFNNKIYGLTKGQYSPTTPKGTITKSSPHGTVEEPFKPGELTIGAQGTFFARTVDTNPKQMKEVFLQASYHKGTSIVEVLQNCVIFNNKIHAEITASDVRDDNQIYLIHNEPMIFGKERNKGLILDGVKLKVVTIGENGITEKDILIHDAKAEDPTIHFMLSRMALPEFPMAMGVIRAVENTVYEDLMLDQIREHEKNDKIQCADDLFNSGNVFEIE